MLKARAWLKLDKVMLDPSLTLIESSEFFAAIFCTTAYEFYLKMYRLTFNLFLKPDLNQHLIAAEFFLKSDELILFYLDLSFEFCIVNIN
jgi:hypothetical protein